MRTTLDIDADLLQRLKQESKRSRDSFRSTVNRILRLGLERVQPESRREYRCATFRMGQPALSHPDQALQVAALLEDEEIVRKLEMRK